MSAATRLGLALLALVVAPGPTAQAAPAPARLERPIVIVGLDGADWQILDPLIAAGRTPHLARLKQRAAWAHLRSYEPILSPLLWTTVATGKPPDEHGVVDFMVRDPQSGRRTPVSSRQRRVLALWDIFSARGLTADVVAWWATWPATPLRGRMVSDRVAYSLFDVEAPSADGAGLTHPAELWPRIAPRVRAGDDVGYAELARFIDVGAAEVAAARAAAAGDPERAVADPINHLARIVASTETYQRIALQLLGEGQPDLFVAYYQGIDEVCHRFAHFMPPRLERVDAEDYRRFHRAVEEFYVYQDELLGQLLAAMSPRSTVIVLSDHGFLNGTARPREGSADIEGKPGKWHRLYGILLVAGEGIPAGRLDSATLYDIAPTVLALAGLPLAADMPGAALLRRAAATAPEARVASYEARGPAAAPAAAAAGAAAVDARVLANLAALGYIEPTAAAPAAGEPATITAHTNLAAVLMQRGDLAGAEAELRRALARDGQYAPALLTLGQVLGRQGKAGEALVPVRAAIDGTPDVEDSAYLQLALLAERAGQRQEAALHLAALRRLRTRAAGIPTAEGLLALHAGEPDVAERHFRAALAIDPAAAEPLGQLFQLYRERGRETELEPLVRAALARNDGAMLPHNWLGLILARRGDTAGAEAQFRRALEFAPDFGGTMANLGSLYGRTGRLEEAVTVLSRAVRLEPRNLEARVNLGAALGKLGRLDAAIDTLEEALRLGLRTPELLDAAGLAHAQRGDAARARELLRESLALLPDQPQVRRLLEELERD